MKLMNTRSFIRGGYLTATEPVSVIRGEEVIGVWTPAVRVAETAPSGPAVRLDERPVTAVPRRKS